MLSLTYRDQQIRSVDLPNKFHLELEKGHTIEESSPQMFEQIPDPENPWTLQWKGLNLYDAGVYWSSK